MNNRVRYNCSVKLNKKKKRGGAFYFDWCLMNVRVIVHDLHTREKAAS